MNILKMLIGAYETIVDVLLGCIVAITLIALLVGYFWIMLLVAKSFSWITTIIVCSFLTSVLVALLGALVEIFGY